MNPVLGITALSVSADADLITGNLLVDVKTTIKTKHEVEDFDQLLGYFLLARHMRRAERSFPEIKRLGIYYARHGHLWSRNASLWTRRAEFVETEMWFLRRLNPAVELGER